MFSNDIFCSLCYILKVNNNDMVCIFVFFVMEFIVVSFDIWMMKEDEEGFVCCLDIILLGFFNGFIYDKCGKDDLVLELVLECWVNNNMVLKKLWIVFLLKMDDIQVIMSE